MAEKYNQFRKRLSARRFVVPVAGVQGSGKSTLLNALAFDTPVLPIDADETTCVPVEIVYAERPSGQAVVLYADGREEWTAATAESIAAFVHHHHNPANEWQVDRVIVESNRPLLQHGLVLVDLPGTGSLTTRNVETTRRYLEEAVGVVFLLRTVPPLTRSESTFVAFHWARLPTAFFVQNRWMDERDEEVEGGRQHNLHVLKQLAARHRIPLDGDPCIHVVNTYLALRGRLMDNAKDMDASGLGRFEADLEARSREWPKVLRDGITAAVRADLHAALEAIERRRGELNADRATVEAQLKMEGERFKKYIDELERTFAEMRKAIESFSSDRRRDIDDWCRIAGGAIRNEMCTKLRQGIVDGPHLSRALLDEESVQADLIFEKVQEELLAFQVKLRERFQSIREWESERTDFRSSRRAMSSSS